MTDIHGNKGDATADAAIITRAIDICERSLRALNDHCFADFGRLMFRDLAELRSVARPEQWLAELVPIIRQHALYSRVLQDPFSRHATARPRGYSGDALLLDFLYRAQTVAPHLEASTEEGRWICELFVSSPAAAAVRSRRDFFANEFDRIALQRLRTRTAPRVLALACGHLREAAIAASVVQRHVKLVGVDQDELSLSHVRSAVTAGELSGDILLIQSSIGRLLHTPGEWGRFDYIYAAGLFDYLKDELASRLILCMFSLLNDGGTLTVTNFLPTTANSASMEVFQDWRLIYRTREQIVALTHVVPRERVAHASYSEDSYQCVGYYQMQHV